MPAFWIALTFVFCAEMGDKTQLVALAFSTRFNVRTIILGVALASASTHLISVIVGQTAGKLLPLFWLNLLAGLFFLVFGWWTLLGKQEDENEDPVRTKLGPLLSVATTFFLAELGDKTMFATIALAAQQHDFWGVWLGSTLGMILASALAVLIGKQMGNRVPEKFVKIAAAGIFFCFGAITVFGAFTGGLRFLQ